MSLLICKIHGESGAMPYISKDLSDFINKKKFVRPEFIQSFRVVFEDEGEYLFDRYYFFSKEEFSNLGLSETYLIKTDKDEEKFRKMLDGCLGITCIYCFKEYMEQIGYDYKM